MLRRVAGLPVLPRMDLSAQRRRTMSRCQRTIVSGVTSGRSPWRRAFGITPSRVTSRARSAQFTCGGRGCRLCRTASWWRRIKISAVFHASSRCDSRSHAATRVIRRKTNRRHMIGDHHGQTAGSATLLVRAMDGILGTHNAASRRSLAGTPKQLSPFSRSCQLAERPVFPCDYSSRSGGAGVVHARTCSARAVTCSGGVVLTMPCPRLNTNGPPLRARRMRSVAA